MDVSENASLTGNENVIEASNQIQRKRPKTHVENDKEGSKHLKRVRGKRGLLKKLVEMPVDLLYEIFSHLNPLDLVYMARTTRALRAMLIGPSSKFIWKAARSNISGLPDCPDDLTEQQYAILMFSTRCMFCQRDLTIVHASFYARVRSCNKCLKLNFLQMSGQPWSWNSQRDYPDLLGHWVPYVKVVREGISKKGVFTRHETYFISTRKDNLWKSEYAALETAQSQDDWLRRTLEKQYIIGKHSRACYLFYSTQKMDADERNAIFDSTEAILQHIKKAGLEDDFYKISPMDEYLEPFATEEFFLNPDPTVFEDFKTAIASEVARRKHSRKSQEFQGIFSRRKDVLSPVWEVGVQTLPLRSTYPGLAEVYRITDSLGWMDYSKTAEEALSVPFDEVVSVWRKQVDDKLLELITDACGEEYVFDPSKVFDLATTFFICTGSCHLTYPTTSRPSMRHDQAVMHRCVNFHPAPLGPNFNLDSASYVFRSVFGDAVWVDTPGSVEFRREDFETMQKVVRMCGLDPRVATAHDMDELYPIFECWACNSVRDGRATMVWAAVLNHQQIFHSFSTDLAALRILEDPEASKVRACIREEQEKAKHQSPLCEVLCSRCANPRPIGNFNEYRDHLKTKHGIDKVPYEELVYAASQICIPPMYRLWPPLDEEDYLAGGSEA